MCMTKQYFFVALLALSFTANAQTTLSLAGNWRFEIDRNDVGVKEKWFSKSLTDNIKLPGSMLENNKGDKVTLQTKWTGSIYDSSWYFNPRYAKYRQPDDLKFPFWLTPAKYYVGAAWYQKEVVIPASFNKQHINFFLERCHTETTVWIDDKEVGTQMTFVVPHQYDLSSVLTPGKHTITIRIDNRIKAINVGPDSHSLTDHTQGNWNGIVGKMELRATPATYISAVQVYPNVTDKSALVKLAVKGSDVAKVIVSAKRINSQKQQIIAPITINNPIIQNDTLVATLPMGKNVALWSEFDPALYQLTATIVAKSGAKSELQTQFGMRSFKTKGTQFTINGQTTFLRGTVENCVFPLTGYAPMDVASWERVFRICKSYGLNHMRFHSYCPPEAAFEAADKLGFYLQPEGPSWANHGSSLGDGKPIDQFIYDETVRMEQLYGNHPSYCMLAYGNEPRGGKQVEYLTKFIHFWQKRDDRRLYTGASVAMSWPLVPENEFMIKSGARNLAWDKLPESKTDYTAAIEKFTMPYLAHEMGQWCAFPNFKEIKKYTGVYKAKNMELFQEDLKDNGMLDQGDKFLQATGKLQVLGYKNEIEKSMRTPNNGGFQLLSLNDYSGQGTALVGVLDAFWDEKGYIDAKGFSKFCNSTVPLARLGKFVYKNDEQLNAGIEIYHYGKATLPNAIVNWQIKNNKGVVVTKSTFKPTDIVTGKNTFIGNIDYALSAITQATQLTLEVSIANTTYSNDWNIWVYPSKLPTISDTSIYYTKVLDAKAEEVLSKGGKVFLNIAGKIVKGKEVVQHFLPVFWNTSWFKMRPPHTLGILLDDKHPAFTNFPTASHSDLQWWEIVNRAQPMHLEDFPKTLRPLIQPIDTWFMNRRLALVFEAKVGNGKLVVSSADLGTENSNRPAANQLFYSMKKYMLSSQFNPTSTIDIALVKGLLQTPSKFVFDAYTKDSPDELKPKSAITAPKN